MKRIFLTFADSRLARSLDRIRSEATGLGVFDQIYTFTERDLEPSFYKKYRNKLRADVRGFGYWCWKPQVIRQTLQQLDYGDLLLYADVGCCLNSQGLSRLEDYFRIVESSESGILAFQAIPPVFPLEYDGRSLPDLAERLWTKGDVFDYFSVRDNKIITESQSYGATTIMLRKSLASVRIIDLWIKAIANSFNLLDDSPSVSNNLEGFIEHRHDQSIFSILCKLNSVDQLSAYEYWYPLKNGQGGDWEALNQMPIHARRNLDFGPLGNLHRFLKNKMNGFKKRLGFD